MLSRKRESMGKVKSLWPPLEWGIAGELWSCHRAMCCVLGHHNGDVSTATELLACVIKLLCDFINRVFSSMITSLLSHAAWARTAAGENI